MLVTRMKEERKGFIIKEGSVTTQQDRVDEKPLSPTLFLPALTSEAVSYIHINTTS